MSVSVGKSYHIKDSFFSLVNDSKLMVNKEGNNYRPHFFFFEDTKTKGIYWAVPQSTKIAKYQAIIQLYELKIVILLLDKLIIQYYNKKTEFKHNILCF